VPPCSLANVRSFLDHQMLHSKDGCAVTKLILAFFLSITFVFGFHSLTGRFARWLEILSSPSSIELSSKIVLRCLEDFNLIYLCLIRTSCHLGNFLYLKSLPREISTLLVNSCCSLRNDFSLYTTLPWAILSSSSWMEPSSCCLTASFCCLAISSFCSTRCTIISHCCLATCPQILKSPSLFAGILFLSCVISASHCSKLYQFCHRAHNLSNLATSYTHDNHCRASTCISAICAFKDA
jgi:hypothetical protein